MESEIMGMTLEQFLMGAIGGPLLTIVMGWVKNNFITNKVARLIVAMVLSGVIALVWTTITILAPGGDVTLAEMAARTSEIWLASLAVWNVVKPIMAEKR
jgi:multisubunit Na+/H+ antiporter MnhB subunit